MPRRDYAEDDRPRPRSRRRYEDDEDDDFEERPRRRRKPPASNPAPLVIGVLLGLFVLLAVFGVGGFLLFRSRAAAPPPAFVNNPPPPMNMNQMGPVGPPAMMPPGGPGMPAGGPMAPPAAPAAAGTEIVISNVRREGFGARQSLVFDYRFPGGRPFGGGVEYVAVVTEPGQQPEAVTFHFLEQSGTMSVQAFAFGGRNAFPSGTTVYMGKRQFGPRGGIPAAISNTLTLS